VDKATETYDNTQGPCRTARQDRGLRAFLSGAAAEQIVEREYQARGARLLERRWRGQSGEIDMILQDGPAVVFCEVKKARNFDTAMSRLGMAQIQRIHEAAAEYLANVPDGQLAQVRFDLAVVNETGQSEIHENAFGHF